MTPADLLAHAIEHPLRTAALLGVYLAVCGLVAVVAGRGIAYGMGVEE